MLCIIRNSDFQQPTQQFTKYHYSNKGLSVGLVPLANDEMVFFFQYDNQLIEKAPTENIADYCARLAKNFPEEIQELVRKNDHGHAHIWRPRDLQLLPTYSKGSIVLMGDAAHVSLPFTSAGVSEAIIDANILVNCLLENTDYRTAFQRYEALRKPQIVQVIALATQLKQQFLKGIGTDGQNYRMPLIGG